LDERFGDIRADGQTRQADKQANRHTRTPIAILYLSKTPLWRFVILAPFLNVITYLLTYLKSKYTALASGAAALLRR